MSGDFSPESAENLDPLVIYRDSIIDIPDTVAALHEEFVQTMPRLDSTARLKAAHYFEPFLNQDPGETANYFAQDDPFVQRKIFELYYGEEELLPETVILRAIAEAPSQGPEEADRFAAMMIELTTQDQGQDSEVTLEGLYDGELQMVISTVLPVDTMRLRSLEPTPAAEYHPDPMRLYNAIERQPLIIGDAELTDPAHVHKLNLPELKRPWEAPVAQIIAALEQGVHVLVDSRRNSGKTHIFPTVLRERAPLNWEISEMTNNFLRGGEGMMNSTTAGDFFTAILRGADIDQTIAWEHRLPAPTPHTRTAATELPERKILIVDEIQTTVLDKPMREAGVLNQLVEWAEGKGVQLVLISAIGDRRSITETQERIKTVLQSNQHVNIEAVFERPEYPSDVLSKILEHNNVTPEVIEWWLHNPVAASLRTMRGVAAMYKILSDVRSYEYLQDYQIRTVEQVGKLLTRVDSGAEFQQRLIDSLAAVCAGSGPQMIALAEYFGIRTPDYRLIGYNEGVTPEDIT